MSDVIISLALSKSRLCAIEDVLLSLMSQTYQPDYIYIWVSEESFLLDEGIKTSDLPEGLISLIEKNSNKIKLINTKNIGPHRKIIPILELFSNKINSPFIITADDDTIYPRNWLKALIEAYNEHGCACAFRTRLINFSSKNYNEWPLISAMQEIKGNNLLINGCDGMLVKPEMFDSRILNTDFLKLCPSRSDLWISGALLAKKTPILKVSKSKIVTTEDNYKLTKDGDFCKSKFLRNIKEEETNSLYIYNSKRNEDMIFQTFTYFNLFE